MRSQSWKPRRLSAFAQGSDELAVYPARLRIFLVALFLFVIIVGSSIATFGLPPTFRLSVGHILGIILLPLLAAIVMICLVGVFSLCPLFSINHDGIRRFSLFGLFGTQVLRWPDVSAIVVTQARGQRLLEITTRKKNWLSTWRLTRRIYADRGVPFIFTSNFAIAGSLDSLLEEIEHRYGQEIDDYRVRLIAVDE